MGTLVITFSYDYNLSSNFLFRSLTFSDLSVPLFPNKWHLSELSQPLNCCVYLDQPTHFSLSLYQESLLQTTPLVVDGRSSAQLCKLLEWPEEGGDPPLLGQLLRHWLPWQRLRS